MFCSSTLKKIKLSNQNITTVNTRGKTLVGELEKEITEFLQDRESTSKIKQIIGVAAKEFPCLSCPSKDECGSFQWFVKWFGKKEP